MPRLLLFFLAFCMLAGCDSQPDRPLTLAERVAGTWALVEVRESATVSTTRFMETVGSVEFELQSVGCCAGRAAYRFTVTRPDGEVIETQQTYLANDNPNDGGDFILLESNQSGTAPALTLLYSFDASYTEMTLTASLYPSADLADFNENIALLGVDFTFRAQPIFVFDKLN